MLRCFSHRMTPISSPVSIWRSMAAAASDRARDFIAWTEGGEAKRARWQSEAGLPAPTRVEIADDTTDAGTALSKASEGVALLYRGDFHNARQLLAAMARRIDARAAH